MERVADNGGRAKQLAWAIERLTTFIDASQAVHVPPPADVISTGSYRTRSPDDEVVQQWAVVERILTRYLPDWQARIQPPDEYRRPGYRWRDHREAAVLCLAAIQSEAEVQQHLGDAGPVMTATGFHPWVWEAARPAWGPRSTRMPSTLPHGTSTAGSVPKSAAGTSAKRTSWRKYSATSRATKLTRACGCR